MLYQQICIRIMNQADPWHSNNLNGSKYGERI
jgi:hypothetical protein